MKYCEIKEARRNAQSPAQQREYLEHYLMSLPSLDGIYLHYTDTDKIGVNPRSPWYETPPGIYTYAADVYYGGPGNYVGVSWKPGFQHKTKWVFVVRAKPETRLFDFGNYSYEQLVQDAPKAGLTLQQMFPNADDEDDIATYDSKQLARRLYYSIPNPKIPLAFQKMGYAGINDPGYGFIHKNEKHQTVFFRRSAFDVLKQLRDYPDTNKHKPPSQINPQQALAWIRQGRWHAMEYLGNQKINLPVDLQQELLTKQREFSVMNGQNQWTKAVQAVANPTDQFLKGLIDMDRAYLVPDSAPDTVKAYLLHKDPTSIVTMRNPPANAEQILAQHFDAKTVQALMQARINK
jgi:hypothetical protein